MKQNKKHPARKGIIILILFLVIVGSYLTILFSNFKPYYKIYYNDIFLGYYKNYNEYEDLYNLILKEEKEKSSYEINLFLAEEVKQEIEDGNDRGISNIQDMKKKMMYAEIVDDKKYSFCNNFYFMMNQVVKII